FRYSGAPLHLPSFPTRRSSDLYKSALIAKGGSYIIRGDRGTTRMMILAQMGPDTLRTGKHHPVVGQGDFDSLKKDTDGNFEVLRSEEHTSELQSRENLVCRLLL